MALTRRAMLGGLLAGGAGSGLGLARAEAPLTSPRAVPRPLGLGAATVPSADTLIATARLGGRVSFAVADAATGRVLEARAPDLAQPPASTAKALTALYALDRLGPDHRFATRLLATGPVRGGRLEGDLVLAGGGDPVLDTDALAGLAAALKGSGVREVAGRFRVAAGALPRLHEIDAEQPDHVGYNPAIGGMNLNHNRVHFAWARQGSGYAVSMDARSASLRPGVTMARMAVVDRSLPVYTYADGGGRDEWTVARGQLGEAGARWLPVRRPGLYAGEVFQVLARSHGIVLGTPEVVDAARGTEIARHESRPLRTILAGMLRYSTNVTAEIVGLAAGVAGGARPATLAASAGAMNGWLERELGVAAIELEDHSGLGDDSRVTAGAMAGAMVAAGPAGALRRLMKPFEVDEAPALTVAAKTGTLNFVSALTGYARSRDGRDLAFAILCSDLPRRDALAMADRERPEGGRAWASRARQLQRGLLARWAVVHAETS